VYPNSGQYHRPHWVFDSVMSPADFAAAALEWAEQGANAIGGCCGLGPNHIASVVTALKTTGPGRVNLPRQVSAARDPLRSKHRLYG
jgi:S-methylmethionine-dependent homocysteine/selenocysteine methylase